MSTLEETKAAQDAKAAEAKAAQDAKEAEAKAAKEAKDKADLLELQEWVARAMINAYPHGVAFDQIDPTPALDKAREFVAAFKAMGAFKPAGPITGLSGTVNKDTNTVTLKWDAPAPATRPGTANSDVNVFASRAAPVPAGDVVIFDGDVLIGTVPSGVSTYTTGMMLPGPHVFTVARKGSPARSNAYSVTIADPAAPAAGATGPVTGPSAINPFAPPNQPVGFGPAGQQ